MLNKLLNKIRKDKIIKYGKYKINYNIKKSIYDEFVDLVNKNTVINTNSNEVKLETKNIPTILKYQINNFTNLKEFVDVNQDIEKLLEIEDENINKIFEYLYGMIMFVLKRYKLEIEKKMNNLEKLLKRVNKED